MILSTMPLRSMARTERLAHPLVHQRVLAVGVGNADRRIAVLVEVDVDDPVGDRAGQGDLGIALELGEVGGRRILDQVDVARQDRRHARGVVGERPQDDLLPLGLAAPIGVVAFEHDAAAALPFDELERAGADQAVAGVELGRCLALRRGAGGGLVRQDGQRRDIERDQGRRPVGVDADRQRIDDLEALHLAGVDRVGAGAVGHLGDAFEGEHHVLGGEVRSVVEFHAGPQLEFPHRVADRLPREREARFRLQVLVLHDQRVEHVERDLQVRIERVILRVERARLGLEPDLELLRRRGGSGESDGRSQ